jgi:hypothetical protein
MYKLPHGFHYIYLIVGPSTFLNKVKYKDIDICQHLFDDVELKTLRDIAELSKVPHVVQTTLRGEKAPTVLAVLSTYEDLLEMLRAYKVICLQLQYLCLGLHCKKLLAFELFAHDVKAPVEEAFPPCGGDIALLELIG